MNTKAIKRLLTLFIIFSLSCNFLTGLTGGDGPANFIAEATSAMSVTLAWPAADGAEKYLIDARIGEQDFIPIAEVPGDQTSYEVFPVPDNSQLIFRLQAVTSSGTNEVGTANVTTPEVTPNPLTVQANQYEPITWEPPTPDPNNPTFDPSSMYPPGFDPNNPESFDPSTLMQQVSASADIGVDGGEVTVTTPDEITYTLSVPAGTLDDVTTITLVPIQSIDGLPFSGRLQGAVRIEPEGLVFDPPATLTMAAPEQTPIVDGMLDIGFAFESDGTEFHLQPISLAEVPASLLPGSAHMASWDGKSQLRHQTKFDINYSYYYGWGPGSKAEARKVVESHVPSAKEDRILNELAFGELYDPDLTPLGYPTALATANLLVKVTDASSTHDVASALEALEALMKYHGNDDLSLKPKFNKILDILVERINDLLKANKQKCLTADDAWAQAIAERLSHPKIGTFSGEMAQRFNDKYGDAVLKEVQQMTKNCVLELKIESKITADFPAGKLTVPVTGTIQNLIFTSRKGKTILSGDGTHESLKYGNIELEPVDKKCNFNVPSGEKFVNVTITLEPIFYPRTETSEGGALQDFKLSIISAKDTSVIQIELICPDGKAQIPLPPGSLWHGLYTAVHMKGKEGITGWEILYEKSAETDAGNHPIYARKIIEPVTISPGYGTWTEDSKFLLINSK